MQQNLEAFLNKQMTRKEFVRHSGLLMLSILGVGNLLRYLAQGGFTTRTQHGSGYGSSAFGGKGRKNLSQNTFK